MTATHEQSSGPQRRAVVVCNGEAPTRDLLLQKWSAVDLRVAADGGGNTLAALGLSADVVVGDLDSLSPEVRKSLPPEAIYHVPGQDTNDADKAIHHCLEQGMTEVHLFGADGGRADQFLANLEVMLRYSREARLVLWSSRERMEFIHDSWQETLAPETVVSLLPIFGPVQSVVTSGLAYPLEGRHLIPGQPPSGVSNQVTDETVRISCESGALLLCVQHTPNGVSPVFSR